MELYHDQPQNLGQDRGCSVLSVSPQPSVEVLQRYGIFFSLQVDQMTPDTFLVYSSTRKVLHRTTLHASAKEWKLPCHYTYSQEGYRTFQPGKQEKETFSPEFITSPPLFSIHLRQCVFKFYKLSAKA